VKIGSANEIKTDQVVEWGKRRDERRRETTTNPKKRELEPYTYKDRLLFLFYIDPLKMCKGKGPYLSLSIDHDAKKEISLSPISLPPIEILRTRLISTKSFKRKSIFFSYHQSDPPASQKIKNK
jgi:hypothetical protein